MYVEKSIYLFFYLFIPDNITTCSAQKTAYYSIFCAVTPSFLLAVAFVDVFSLFVELVPLSMDVTGGFVVLFLLTLDS
jgi:hypothetical protein